MTEIFKFENQQVRFVGTADKPWWVAADVCNILEISNVSQKLQTLDGDERSMFNIGRQGEAWCVNESGLYSLILTSRKPQAKKFKKWVTSEVLPAIRNTGKYSINNSNLQTQLAPEKMFLFADYAANSAQNAGISKALVESIKLDTIMEAAPESKPFLLPQKQAIISANPLTEQAVTPTVIGQRLAQKLGLEKISSRAINKKLLALGYQTSVTRIKRSTGKETHDHYQPTEKTLNGNHGQLEMTSYQDGTGKGTKYQLRWFNSIVDILAQNWEVTALPPSSSSKTKLSRKEKKEKVKNAILANLVDDNGKLLSNRAIARLCDVSHSMVDDTRRELFPTKKEKSSGRTKS